MFSAKIMFSPLIRNKKFQFRNVMEQACSFFVISPFSQFKFVLSYETNKVWYFSFILFVFNRNSLNELARTHSRSPFWKRLQSISCRLRSTSTDLMFQNSAQKTARNLFCLEVRNFGTASQPTANKKLS